MVHLIFNSPIFFLISHSMYVKIQLFRIHVKHYIIVRGIRVYTLTLLNFYAAKF